MLVRLFFVKNGTSVWVLPVFYRKIAQKSIKYLLMIGKNVTYSSSETGLCRKQFRRRIPVRINICWEPE